ncbi:MAG TPA: ABC transporter ATP-binding protein [Desulfobacteraceae bacterium]|nr:ABC transporter ATP-binding protein [Desulfobacteraceae bacterium]HPJ66820.1 ABC transporter ATP-binding protein [Desulfobacteraceae bacterium]HPQ27030.1 ABC transporter ATP-binding protein [Desulfobacteraceae bacterium]
MILLNIDGITKKFGALAAVDNFSCDVIKGECHALIGPNGAGKTTTFNMIAGYLRPTKGKIFFNGENIAGLKPHVIARKGIARTFQIRVLFDSLSVLENMMAACHLKSSSVFIDMVFQTRHSHEENKRLEQLSLELLEIVGLSDFSEVPAGTLGHVAQGKLGLGMALAMEPQVLLLDEPVSGMTPSETEEMLHLIKQTLQRGITVLLVEHNMKAVMSVADRITVLDFGQKIAEGAPNDIINNPDVIKAYLGE